MSSSYKALTRAYRPQTFDDIVSQEHVSNTLKNAIENNRLSHAYLFCGPRGVGKTTMARVLARTINNVDMDVDGEQLNNTLNIVEIDAASNNSVDDVRSLRERVRIPPQSGRFKVYIIDEIHMLSKAAFNALLKTLEEPPAHVIFIFATTEPHRILPTILSRCQRFDFRRITVEEIVARLELIARKEDIEIDRESLHVIARKADGALRDALGILDQAIAFCGTSITYDDLHRALNIVSSERMFELTDALIRRDARAGMALLHNLLHIGNDIQEFLAALTEHFRNLYLSRDSQNFYLIEATKDTRERFQEMASAFSEDDLMRMMHIVHEAEFSIRQAQQPRIHLEITLLKLFHMTRSDGLSELLLKLEALEQKMAGQGTTGTQKGGAPVRTPVPEAKHERPPLSPSPTEKPENSSGTPAPSGGPADSPRQQQAKPAPPPRPAQEPHQVSQTGESRSLRDEPDIFGSPALRRPQGHLSAVTLPERAGDAAAGSEVRGNLALSPKPKELVKPAPAPSKKIFKKPDTLDDLNAMWPEYLSKLQATTSSMLYFSIQKARPVQLRKNVVTLECGDSFTSDIIREQQRKLCDTVKEHFGYALRFTSQLVEKVQRTDTIHDPYEHFSELQKKDPKLKKIVNLFGAELEY
jgi:DNA polymerase III subunit gamma/tau